MLKQKGCCLSPLCPIGTICRHCECDTTSDAYISLFVGFVISNFSLDLLLRVRHAQFKYSVSSRFFLSYNFNYNTEPTIKDTLSRDVRRYSGDIRIQVFFY